MPKPIRQRQQVDLTTELKVWRWHGVQFDWNGQSENAVGDCYACGKEGKLSINAATGEAHCWVCTLNPESPKGGVNLHSFLHTLWKLGDAKTTTQCSQLAKERGLLFPETIWAWGLALNPLNKFWIIPSWSADNKLVQLWTWKPDWNSPQRKHRLFPTPGMGGGGLFWPIDPSDRGGQEIHHHESLWNAMAYWEVLRRAKRDGERLTITGTIQASLASGVTVSAGQGCGSVGEPLEKLSPIFAGKKTVLFFDNDHPKQGPNGGYSQPGLEAARRACGILDGRASEVYWLKWGNDGYNKDLDSGWDVRDSLVKPQQQTIQDRLRLLSGLVKLIEPVPTDWMAGRPIVVDSSGAHMIEPLPCREWKKLVTAWKAAMQWRQGLEDVLALMIAVSSSTELEGDNQAFLQVVGSAGGGKTKFCEALLVSRRCHQLDHLTSFFSGWKGEGGKDCSLIARTNKKTLITPEADVLVSQPNFQQLMSQQRRIFDGNTSHTYANTDEDKRYSGIRMPWIMAGTPAMLMNTDQSRLGDRFLKVWIEDPSESDRQEILRRVAWNALQSSQRIANDGPASCLSPEMLKAYQLTGGYVDWLRDNISDLISADKLKVQNPDKFTGKCGSLAEFAADLRARPQADLRKDDHSTKEIPTRLTAQMVRVATCLAAVLNRKRIDDPKVMELLRKLSIDTARGKTFDLVKNLAMVEIGACSSKQLANWTHMSEDKCQGYLKFLRRIKVIESTKPPNGQSGGWWKLTERMRDLWNDVVETSEE